MDEKKIEELDNKQYIVVKLGSEQYGIDIQYVDNIVRMQRVTRVPKAQPYFKGVINIRGEVIPVMSLRLKFGLEPDEFKNATRILIIKIDYIANLAQHVKLHMVHFIKFYLCHTTTPSPFCCPSYQPGTGKDPVPAQGRYHICILPPCTKKPYEGCRIPTATLQF